MSVSKPAQPSRRRIITGASPAGALAATAVALPLVRQNALEVTATASAAPESSDGYRLTEHVLRYYQTARV